MKNELFNELLKSMHEMDRIVQGELVPGRVTRFTEPEVKQIRMNTGLSQKHFAALIGVSKRTLENWEQGRRTPAGPARALLKILHADPEHTLRALHGQADVASGTPG